MKKFCPEKIANSHCMFCPSHSWHWSLTMHQWLSWMPSQCPHCLIRSHSLAKPMTNCPWYFSSRLGILDLNCTSFIVQRFSLLRTSFSLFFPFHCYRIWKKDEWIFYKNKYKYTLSAKYMCTTLTAAMYVRSWYNINKRTKDAI